VPFTQVYGLDGKCQFWFDGVYIALKGEEEIMLLVEAQHHVQVSDVGDLAQKKCLLAQRMNSTVDASGMVNYRTQHEHLRKYASFRLQMVIGCPRVDADAAETAAAMGGKVVQVSDGRYKLIL
jgi:hypothetical protein